MPLYPPKAENNFTPPPSGSHLGVCVDVRDMGLRESSFFNDDGSKKMQHKVLIMWQLNKRISDPSHKAVGKRHVAVKMYTFSANEKSNLAKDWKSWTGETMTNKTDLESCIGKNCILTIVHNESNGKVYANVISVAAPIEGMTEIQPEDYVRKAGITAPVTDEMIDNLEPPPHTDQDFAQVASKEDEGLPF